MHEFKDIKKILVIKLRHIGDVLLSVPVFRTLRGTFPDAHISVLVNAGTEDVLNGNPLIDEIISFDRKIKDMHPPKKYLNELLFLNGIRSKRFNMIVDLNGGDRPAIISFLSGARYRLGNSPVYSGFWRKYLYTHLAERDLLKHTILQNLDVIKEFGIDTKKPIVDIFIPEDAQKFAEKVFAGYGIKESDTVVHVHPTSRWFFKCGKDEYMAEVIKQLIEKGIKVVVTSSADEREMDKAKKILSLVNLRLLDLCGKTSIKHLAAVAKMSNLFIGVDSMPMHIAAAVNTPVIALFGPTGAYNWGPWDNHSSESRVRSLEFRNPYSKRNGIQTFGRHTVIQRDWECVPCGASGCNFTKISRCLEEITPQEIIEIAMHKLKETGKTS